MLDQITKDAKEHFERTLDHLKKEFAAIRTARANPAMLEEVMVEAYESSYLLKELASISAPEHHLLLVSPFDPQIVYQIEKAIRMASLGLNPATVDNLIRVPIPEMSGERRQELVKMVHQKAEETKVVIRQIRQDKIQAAEELEESGKISEDDEQRFKKELQRMVEEYNGKVDLLREGKERELLEA